MNKQKRNKLISYEEIELVIKKMDQKEFNVLNFYDYIRDNKNDLYERINLAYMNNEGKKSYSPLNYISSSLVHYSRQKNSLLYPHVSYEKDNSRCFRKVTEVEKARFKSDNIAIYKLK